MLLSCLSYYSTLKMVATHSSERSGDLQLLHGVIFEARELHYFNNRGEGVCGHWNIRLSRQQSSYGTVCLVKQTKRNATIIEAGGCATRLVISTHKTYKYLNIL
jgi:hypothetical protein